MGLLLAKDWLLFGQPFWQHCSQIKQSEDFKCSPMKQNEVWQKPIPLRRWVVVDSHGWDRVGLILRYYNTEKISKHNNHILAADFE